MAHSLVPLIDPVLLLRQHGISKAQDLISVCAVKPADAVPCKKLGEIRRAEEPFGECGGGECEGRLRDVFSQGQAGDILDVALERVENILLQRTDASVLCAEDVDAAVLRKKSVCQANSPLRRLSQERPSNAATGSTMRPSMKGKVRFSM